MARHNRLAASRRAPAQLKTPAKGNYLPATAAHPMVGWGSSRGIVRSALRLSNLPSGQRPSGEFHEAVLMSEPPRASSGASFNPPALRQVNALRKIEPRSKGKLRTLARVWGPESSV
jgi:hypothetical protein